MAKRERLLKAVKAGATCHAVAERFDVSASAVIKLMQRYRAKATISPGKMGGNLRSALEPHYDRVRAPVAETPDNLFAKIKSFLRACAERNVEALWDSIGKAIKTISQQDCQNCFRHAGYS